MCVEVGLVLGEDRAQVAGVHDEDPVQEFTAYAPDPVIAFIRGACGAVSRTRFPSARKTSSNIAVNFASRSRIKNLKPVGCGNRADALDLRVRGSGMLGLRASWLVVFWSAFYLVLCRIFQLLMLFGRGDRAKDIEIVALRHQVAVLRRQVKRPDLNDADRVVLAALSRFLPRPSWNSFFVAPATLLRWHRNLIAREWTYPRRRPGRPSTRTDIRDAVLRMARDNLTWGCQRISGELAGIGVRVPPSTVHDILKRAGLDPAPRRSGPTWGRFLKTQAEVIMACDVFHVDTVLLKRIYVLFFIEHASRVVHIAGATANPTGTWVAQQARNLVLDLGERAEHIKFLIRDRDAKFTRVFDEVFASLGARVIRTGSPRANAIAERWVGTIRRECTDRLLIYNERHLRRVLAAYEQHYNTHRPHRARDRRPPQPRVPAMPPTDLDQVHLKRRQAVHGLINEYRSAA
ncbi:MAG: integrase core domain-containing protein [Actinoallomurus sp.]